VLGLCACFCVLLGQPLHTPSAAAAATDGHDDMTGDEEERRGLISGDSSRDKAPD
jgi:hypothetical protein